jgi:uncharacterized protein (TIGR02596 family)
MSGNRTPTEWTPRTPARCLSESCKQGEQASRLLRRRLSPRAAAPYTGETPMLPGHPSPIAVFGDAPTGGHAAAFSLIELLIVIAIMAILLALTVPAFNSISSGRKLDQAASQVVDNLSLARQTAMAHGCRVRWELADIGTGTNDYRIHRLVEFKSGTWQAASKWVALDANVQVNPDPARSGLIGSVTNSATTNFTYGGTNYSNKNAIPVTFLPDGTTLLSGSNTFLTVEPIQGPKDASGKSPNWSCIVINPVTGRATAYRP